ncbi:hypothetical protein [Candidatus Palauibacter sp.]|uniref:hypothetical protein n=1 Tax=Candidatus Palauibacter sp. TaxID=3101350 RepID=UPI003B52B9C2
MKRRNLIIGSLTIAALLGAALGVAPFGATAQDEPQGLLSFDNFDCPGECAPSAPVCCWVAPPIIVVID